MRKHTLQAVQPMFESLEPRLLLSGTIETSAISTLDVVPTAAPIVYWSFDNASDLGHDDSGNGHSLTIPGPATSVPGAIGNAVSFSGYGVGHTYFDRGYNPTSSPWGPFTSTSSLDYPGNNGLTVSYWTKIESGKSTIVWDYWQHRVAGETFGLEYKESTGQASFFVRTGFTDPAPRITAPVSEAIGSWVHLAGVYEPNGYGLKLYVNGQLAAQDNMSAPIRTQRAPYFYADGSWHSTSPAKLDEVRLYNTALTANEIAGLSGTPTPPDVDPVDRAPDPNQSFLPNSGQLRVFTNDSRVYPSKPTIVLTHGWVPLDSYQATEWYESMADALMNSQVDANVVAWEWLDGAGGLNLGLATSRTTDEGSALGEALFDTLETQPGEPYESTIHFIGHSLGTLVNAEAVDTLHTLGFDPENERIHVTLLDDAYVANVAGALLLPTRDNWAHLRSPQSWPDPIPDETAWVDNYISAVGSLWDSANNIILQKREGDSVLDWIGFHDYPVEWYEGTILNPDTSQEMGHRWSFERGTLPVSVASYYIQDPDGPEFDLKEITRTAAEIALEYRYSTITGSSLLGLDSIIGAIEANGKVLAEAVLKSTVTGSSTWTLRLMLEEASPAYAWVPITVPDDAAMMSFEFFFDGMGDDDWLSFGVGDELLFAIEGEYIDSNQLFSSGLLDISAWAGQDVELFFGLNSDGVIGGTVTIEGIEFYSVAEPVYIPGNLSGRVYADADDDGEVDAGESGISGVVVQLSGTDILGNTVTAITAVTDDSGYYDFPLVIPGTYTLTEIQPDGYLDGKDTAGSLGGVVADELDIINGIEVGSGQTGEGYNFADLLPSSLAGLTYVDFNDDGEVNFGEAGISGVTVTLTGTDMHGDPIAPVVQTTESTGAYLFENLRPGTYTITETQPVDYIDGKDTPGGPVGLVENDTFREIDLLSGMEGVNYNFGERPLPGTTVQQGMTATIGFWRNKHGQSLIRSLNDNELSTQLGDWLAATFGNLYGAGAGTNSLAGKSNAYVADYFSTLFKMKGPKLGAQVLATALSVYVTNSTLAGTVAVDYGFAVSEYGLGAATFNVGSYGAAFNVEDDTEMTVLDLLLATDSLSTNGLLYDLDGDLRVMANEFYTAINEQGDI